jgi:hypothetical protein
MIKRIENTGAILTVTVALWLGFKMVLNLPMMETTVYSLAVSGIITAFAFYSWQPGGHLEKVGLLGLVAMFVGGVILIGMYLLCDAVSAHANLLDISQWPKLENSSGFAFTAVCGFFIHGVLFATLVRLLILKAIMKVRNAGTAGNR